jgi:hypothetical protein
VAALLLARRSPTRPASTSGLISIADNCPFSTLERKSSSNWRKLASNDSRP